MLIDVLYPTANNKALLKKLFKQQSDKAHFKPQTTYTVPRWQGLSSTNIELSHTVVFKKETGQYYVLEKELSSGAFGIVYPIRRVIDLNGQDEPGESESWQCTKVLKLMSTEDRQEKERNIFQSFIERENKLSQQISYLNAEPYFRQGFFSYMVMDFVKGRELNEPLKKDHDNLQNLSMEQRLNLLLNLLESYQKHFAQEGLVHADLKPSNILVDDDLSCHIIDLGNAFEVNNIPDKLPLGTVPYCSMELLEKNTKALSEKTDVFSLARIFILIMRPETIKNFFHAHDGLHQNERHAWYKYMQKNNSMMLPIFREINDDELHQDLKESLYNVINTMLQTKQNSRPTIEEVKRELCSIIRRQQARTSMQHHQTLQHLLGQDSPVRTTTSQAAAPTDDSQDLGGMYIPCTIS